MLSLLGGLNAITERTLTRCMTSALESLITELAQKVALFAGILRTCGKRKFMRSIIDRRSRSSLEFYLHVLDRRKVALCTSPKRLQRLLSRCIAGSS